MYRTYRCCLHLYDLQSAANTRQHCKKTRCFQAFSTFFQLVLLNTKINDSGSIFAPAYPDSRKCKVAKTC